MNYYNLNYFFPIILGYNFSIILNYLGILSGQQGVDYYGEAHLSPWNSLIHTLFMPFTSYGFLLSVPALLNLDQEKANKLQNYVYVFYTGHYVSISLVFGLIFAFIYELPLYFSIIDYKNNRYTLIKGLIISITCLIVQEFVGHYLGRDIPSREEGVLNAVIYANYYAVSNIFLK